MTDCSTHSLSGWTNCRLDLFLFIFSRSYLKYPVKIIALYYESVCPTYFLSALQPNPFVLRLFSCHMGWCSPGFSKKKWQLIYFIFLKVSVLSINRFYNKRYISSKMTDAFLILIWQIQKYFQKELYAIQKFNLKSSKSWKILYRLFWNSLPWITLIWVLCGSCSLSFTQRKKD